MANIKHLFSVTILAWGTFCGGEICTRVATPDGPIDQQVISRTMLPRGSALLTSSGELAKTGIQAIIHAAPGAMTLGGPTFKPTIEGVQESIRNSLELARRNGYKRVAIPFVGGEIFLGALGVTRPQLAEVLARAAIKNRGDLEIRIVAYTAADRDLFVGVLAQIGNIPPEVELKQGDITDFSAHQSPVIVNGANMEVMFGGGISGAVAQASGHREEIDHEALQTIKRFYTDCYQP